MSRRIATRIKIDGRLTAQGPLHVGGKGGNEDVDLMIALDGENRPYIPGTSLAGALRGWLFDRTDSDTVGELFGMVEKKTEKGWASYVIIEDGSVDLKGKSLDQIVERRDGVGIDRNSGAAADGIKYDSAILPHSSQIYFEMTVEIGDKKTKDETDIEFEARKAKIKSHVGAMLRALEAGEVRLGAAKSRGHGIVKLKINHLREQDLKNPDGILEALKAGGKPITVDDLNPAALTPVPQLTINIDWRPDGPLMVKAERDGVAVDMLPLTSSIGGKLTFSLPGSSIKGALRSQAERIIRTVVPATESKSSFLEQVEVPLVMDLFGQAGKEEKDDPDLRLTSGPLPGLSALFVEDCYAKDNIRFKPDQWENIAQAGNSEQLLKALNDAGLAGNKPDSPQVQQAFHVAVDRWTGGAADGFLYSVLEPHGVPWEEIVLKVKLNRLASDKTLAAIACLLFVLRDLANGRIPLGFGANRGMGAVIIKSITFKTEGIDDEAIAKLNIVSIADGKIDFKDGNVKKALNDAWKSEIDKIKAKLVKEEE